MEALAYAKLNLTLDVLGKRQDGYHELRMVMQSISLADRITLQSAASGAVQVTSSMRFLPTGERNLAGKAILAFWNALGKPNPGYAISLEKRIPVCAGMGGGSSDAACVLRMLNEQAGYPFSVSELARVGEQVGSDVPYCVMGGTALAEGRGEILTPLPSLPGCWAVVCKPDFSVSTPELFTRLDRYRLQRHPDTTGLLRALEAGDLAGVARRMYNVFEDVLPAKSVRQVMPIRVNLIRAGALGACMSGTGPTVFGLFEREEEARNAVEILKTDHRDTFLTQTIE